jgi:hypothetical protein
MSQLLDTLIGMDPSGDGALLLCVITSMLLGMLLVVGFGLVRPTRQSRKQGTRLRSPSVAELGLPALWRLNRSIGKSDQFLSGDSPSVDSVRTTP